MLVCAFMTLTKRQVRVTSSIKIFLVMFFFAIGASFEFQFLKVIIVPAVILAVLILIIKPLLYSVLLRWGGEPKSVANEVGVRLGQAHCAKPLAWNHLW
mgnify:CR=1 FL=1